MNEITVVEVCPECGTENEMQWDFEQFGLNAFCPVCGSHMMLCDECMHRDALNSHCGDADGKGHCLHYKDCSKRRYNQVESGGPAYDVEITEVLKKTVSVNANTADEAEREVACRYKEGDFILDETALKSRTVVAVNRLNIYAE